MSSTRLRRLRPGRTAKRDPGTARVPEHEQAQSFLRGEPGGGAGVFELAPWLLGHAEGAFVVALVRHVSQRSGWYHLTQRKACVGGTTGRILNRRKGNRI